MKLCRGCGEEINPLRVQALPGTPFCVGCADGRVKQKRAFPVLVGGDIEHGASTIAIVEGDGYDTPVADRDLMDVEPEQFAKDPRIPLTIPKREELG